MMARNEVKRCSASNIYSQGVTFPQLRVVVNAVGGGANTSAVQKPGRVAQLQPGKRCGVVIDFLFEGYGTGKGKVWAPASESKSRLNLYRDKDYEVIMVDDLSEFPKLFKEHCV